MSKIKFDYYFNNILQLIYKWFELKYSHPIIRFGKILINSGVISLTSGLIINFFISYNDSTGKSLQINFTSGDSISLALFYIGLGLLVFGIIIYIIGLYVFHKKSPNYIFYYLIGLPNQQEHIPYRGLEKKHRGYKFDPVVLKLDNDKPSKEMYEQLKFHQKTIIERVHQKENDQLFFAGLARVPYLFFIGYSFRNAHSEICLLDHNHSSSKWFELNIFEDFKCELITDDLVKIMTNEYKNIAVLIEFTCNIPTKDVPQNLHDKIVRLKLSSDFGHNQIKHKLTLDRIVEDIVNLLIQVNKKCDMIHLFIAAQSTVIFSLGRRYQEGMIGDIRVYNYNAKSKQYDWSIALINNHLKLM